MTDIRITEQDFPRPEKRIPAGPKREIVLPGYEGKLRVTLGTPTEEWTKPQDLWIPDTPHIFTVDTLRFFDRNHNRTSEFENSTVVFAHGVMVGAQWQFANGQSVHDTVEAYNIYAGVNNLPYIEVVAACSGAGSQVSPEGKFLVGLPSTADLPIVHALGDSVNIGGAITVDSKVLMDITNNSVQPLNNLDQLDALHVGSKIKLG